MFLLFFLLFSAFGLVPRIEIVQLAILAPIKVRSPPAIGLCPARLAVTSVRQRDFEPGMGGTLGVAVAGVVVDAAVDGVRWGC